VESLEIARASLVQAQQDREEAEQRVKAQTNILVKDLTEQVCSFMCPSSASEVT
jgi:hypothetical protein